MKAETTWKNELDDLLFEMIALLEFKYSKEVMEGVNSEITRRSALIERKVKRHSRREAASYKRKYRLHLKEEIKCDT